MVRPRPSASYFSVINTTDEYKDQADEIALNIAPHSEERCSSML